MYDDLQEQVRIRREKMDRLRASGVDPYPLGFPRTPIRAVRDKYQLFLRSGEPPLNGLEAKLTPDVQTGDTAAVAGRVMLARNSGKLCFATLRDGSGEIQVMLSVASIGAGALESWKRDVDLGDHVGIEGEVITSKRGELSVMADRYAITSKCLRPLPEKHAGLTDPEQRVRQRYLDLIVNDEARRMVRLRSDAIRGIREFLAWRGYLEVETPILQPVHGWSAAQPFRTHINAYDMDLHLRIAPETYLKRCAVAGLEKVFEIGRNFRNEGADSTHNPEFTMLEAYQAYGDYDTVATLTREIYLHTVVVALGSTVVRHGTAEVDLAGDWPQVTLYGSVSAKVGEEITTDTPVDAVRKLFDAHGLTYDPKWGQGKLVQELFEELVEHTLIQPTFVRDYPVETSPLTRQHRDDPRLTEKWDLIGFGTELGTGYSELIDPIEQRRRLTEQSSLAPGADPASTKIDEDFLFALEYAMPPTGGIGLGIDRMVMAFTGKNIRETILFPLVKPT